MRLALLCAAAAFGVLSPLGARAATVTGESVDHGTGASCVRVAPFPGAVYSESDRAQEDAYCALDFDQLALCPKLWSTSPATIVYDVGAEDPADWEEANCSRGSHARDVARANPAMYKMSINGHDTSATFAPASWVYYHFSRYFDTAVRVPVAVYRSMPADEHNRRVTRSALELTADRRRLRMLAAGWRLLDAAETGEASGSTAAEVLTSDRRSVFGVLLKSEGRRYGAEVNGTRESGWGSGQNEDFQQTAPFIALRDPRPVAEAARAAIVAARRNPLMAEDLPADTPVEQVVFWMQEVLEIALLDYLLGQQDRIGNIDYSWRWYWVEDGTLRSVAASADSPPAAAGDRKALRLRRTAINDNDAGVRSSYANFAERTGMLSNLRHISPGLYRRLGRLAADYQQDGPAREWLTKAAGLSEREAGAIARRTLAAWEQLSADCRSGRLKLDLVPAALLDDGLAPTPETVSDCEVDED